MVLNSEASDIHRAIEQATSVVVVSHDRPDGDAIGSTVALGLLLEAVGKEVTMLNHDEVPQALRFLPCSDRIQTPGAAAVDEVDLVVSLDAAGRDRINDRVWDSLPADSPILNIDHHVSNSRFGTWNYVDDRAPATGEILFDLCDAFAWRLTRDVAENLYAAISTDTGSFRYPNTTAKTYRAAAAMIDAGVDVGTINQQLYESYPLRRVECLRDLLPGLKMSFGGRCASVTLGLEQKNRLGLRPGDTEGVIDILRAIDTVQVAVFFEELEGGKIRVSARSKKEWANVGRVCAAFGGGGHHLAAGTRMSGPLEEAERQFLAAVGETFADSTTS